jgi:hypothetical protein
MSVIADIRKMQSRAMSGTVPKEEVQAVCGYGLQYDSQNSYLLFYKTDCGSMEYDAGDPSEKIILSNSDFILQWDKTGNNYHEIYFKSPDPITYINGKTLDVTENQPDKQNPYTEVCIRPRGLPCESLSCSSPGCVDITTVIKVYASGQIDVSN